MQLALVLCLSSFSVRVICYVFILGITLIEKGSVQVSVSEKAERLLSVPEIGRGAHD